MNWPDILTKALSPRKFHFLSVDVNELENTGVIDLEMRIKGKREEFDVRKSR